MDRIFILAQEDAKDEAQKKAINWANQRNQTRFTDTRNTAIDAITEYILNEKGYTSFECNAKYPKINLDEYKIISSDHAQESFKTGVDKGLKLR